MDEQQCKTQLSASGLTRACLHLHYILPDRAWLQDGIVEPGIDGDISRENLFQMAMTKFSSSTQFTSYQFTIEMTSEEQQYRNLLLQEKYCIMHYRLRRQTT